MQNELNNHLTVINKLVENGLEMTRTQPQQADEATNACEKLKKCFGLLQEASEARKDILQRDCEAFQVFYLTYFPDSLASIIDCRTHEMAYSQIFHSYWA